MQNVFQLGILCHRIRWRQLRGRFVVGDGEVERDELCGSPLVAYMYNNALMPTSTTSAAAT
jgi:hypothetical protein